MNRWIIIAAHAVALSYDGWTTRKAIEHGYIEKDPIAQKFIGTRPTTGKMVGWGTVELGGATFLTYRFPKAKWIQISLVAAHTEAATGNVVLLNKGGDSWTRQSGKSGR